MCDHCGQMSFGEKHSYKDLFICDDCYREYYAVCEMCGELHRRSEMTMYIEDGKDVFCCSDCAEKYNIKCATCGKEISVHSAVTLNRMSLCKECADQYVCTPYNGYVHKSKVVRFNGEYFLRDEELYVFVRKVCDENFLSIIDNSFNRYYTHIIVGDFPAMGNDLVPVARVKFVDSAPDQPLELLPEDARKKWHMRSSEVILFANYYLCAEEVL